MSELKETKEFIVGAVALGKVIAAELSDGFQAADLMDLAKKLSSDEAFRAKVWEAAKGIGQIPEELKEAPAAKIVLEIGQAALDALKSPV